jgi:hypothetical protein
VVEDDFDQGAAALPVLKAGRLGDAGGVVGLVEVVDDLAEDSVPFGGIGDGAGGGACNTVAS